MALPTLTDSHAHLQMDAFDSDRTEVIRRAAAQGVRRILNVALGPEREKLESVLAFVEPIPGMFASVGVHPHDAEKMDAGSIEVLRSLAGRPKVVAIGEIGLDYHYNHSTPETQRKRFAEQLDLALEVKRPVILHSREAFEDTFRFTSERQIFKKVGGVLHCFTGNAEEARRYAAEGAYLSFSGIVTFSKAEELRKAAAVVPEERLLIETDCPYLAPEPYRGKRNEPAYVARVAETLAKVRGKSVEEIARITSENASRLFQLGGEELSETFS